MACCPIRPGRRGWTIFSTVGGRVGKPCAPNPGGWAAALPDHLFILWGLFGVLVSPMILGFSDARGLGLILSVAGGGMLFGSLAMSVWGGPRRRLRGLLGFELASAAAFVWMGLRPNLILVAGAAFLAHATLAFVSGLNQSIWQSQVAPAVLGRVLGLRQAAVKGATLLAYLLAGGLADRVLEPMLLPGGALATSLGAWIGIGPGRGIAALCVLIGLVKAAAVAAVYAFPGARELDGQFAGSSSWQNDQLALAWAARASSKERCSSALSTSSFQKPIIFPWGSTR